MELYKYQKEIIDDIILKFQTKNKICLQLATSGGKTFIFSNLAKYWIKNNNCKILVLCHRQELISQAISEMQTIGVTCEAITSKVKNLNHLSDVYVAMAQTISNRLNKDHNFIKNIGLIIVDECHYQIFEKIFGFFKNSKILGVTATPVVLKRIKFFKCKYCKNEYEEFKICCNHEIDEWTRPFKMSQQYEDVIIGPKINELIDDYGSLVRDISYVKNYANLNNLKTDSDGEFTSESLDKTYSNDDAVFNVFLNYQTLCLGKKTIIFNSSTHNNLSVYNKFIIEGINARMYDSVNKEQSGCRIELVEWFNNNDDAVLLNVGCFIAGFNSKEVQAIILNLAVGSLSVFIQMCGRGARTTDKFYKDSFILIDGGGNIDRHQEFSDPTRDWKRIFFEGIGKDKVKKEDIIDINECPNCGYLYQKSKKQCPECGHIIEPKEKPQETLSDEILQPIREIPKPNGEKIYKYTILQNENINFSFKILIGQIIDLFIMYQVQKETYINTKKNGNLQKKVKNLIHNCYFTLLAKSDIKTENNRTISFLVQKTITKLDTYYKL